MIVTKGLNGFWGDFWNGLKSAFNIGEYNNAQANNRSFGSRFAQWFKSIVDISTGGILKNDYVPIGTELLLYNRIKLQLNNFVINELNKIDSSANKLDAINDAIRKLQLIQEFVDARKVKASNEFQMYLSEQIAQVIQSFELNTEDILDGNNINFAKVETPLLPNQSDNYPIDLKPNSTTPIYGFQYTKEGNEPIQIDVPSTINSNVSIIPKPIDATTDIVAGGQKPKSFNMTFLFVGLAIVVALIPNKSEKEK